MATSPLDALLSVLWDEGLDVRVYLFGSWLFDPTTANDIDVALVYPHGRLADSARVAERLRGLYAAQTLDVIALSEAEEDELSFLASARAVCIWPPDVAARPPLKALSRCAALRPPPRRCCGTASPQSA